MLHSQTPASGIWLYVSAGYMIEMSNMCIVLLNVTVSRSTTAESPGDVGKLRVLGQGLNQNYSRRVGVLIITAV